MGLVIPELENLLAADEIEPQLLYEALKKMQNYVNRIPIIVGEGDPNGQVAAKPGTFFIPKDPLMGAAFYIKVTGTDENGWAEPLNSLSGFTRVRTVRGGSTTNAGFTVVDTIDFVPPANTRQMSFNVTVTGAGAVRLRIKGTSIYSNELTGSGKLTLNSIPNTARAIEVECKATAGTFTADVDVYENRGISGDQVSGSRQDSQGAASAGPASPDPPELPMEHPSFGNPDAFIID